MLANIFRIVPSAKITSNTITSKNLDMKEFFVQKLIYFLAAILFFYKSRIFFLEPRIWAEEGTVYLKDSILNGSSSLLSVHQGYYSILPNVTFYIASLFNPKYIPYFSVFTSLCIWLLLFVLIISLKKNIYKSLLFISIFVVLNQFQQLFLNTINLQFITPLLLLIFLQHDLKILKRKRKRKRKILFLIIIFISIFNGVLGLLLFPYLFYKLIISKLYKTLIFTIGCVALYAIIYFLFKENSVGLSVSERFFCNLNQKYNYVLKNQVSFIKMHFYPIFIIIALVFMIKRKWEIAIICVICFINYLFIDLTKMCGFFITERYRVYLYAMIIIFFYEIIYKYSNTKILYIPTIIIALFFSKNFFKTDYSYCKECSQWSTEYKNLIDGKNVKIHPAGWEINL